MDKEPILIDLKGVPCSDDKELAPRDIKRADQIATKNFCNFGRSGGSGVYEEETFAFG